MKALRALGEEPLPYMSMDRKHFVGIVAFCAMGMGIASCLGNSMIYFVCDSSQKC